MTPEHMAYIKAIQVLRPNEPFSLSIDGKELVFESKDIIAPTREEINTQIEMDKLTTSVYTILNSIIVNRIIAAGKVDQFIAALDRNPRFKLMFYCDKETMCDNKEMMDLLASIEVDPKEILNIRDKL